MRDRSYILNSFHPLVGFVYLVCVVALSVCISLLEFSIASFLLAILASSLLRGADCAKPVAGALILIVVVSLLSPFFTPLGQSVLFTYFGRPYTLEAIIYGASVGLMFASMLMWFYALSSFLDAQKALYLFKNVFPKLALIMTSTLSLIKRFTQRLKEASLVDEVEFAGARAFSAGEKDTAHKRRILRIRMGASRILNLAQWSFVEGIDRADTMRSRGFSSGRKTSYRRYHLQIKDVIAVAAVVCISAFVVLFLVIDPISMTYFPTLAYSSQNAGLVNLAFVSPAFCLFVLLLSLPSISVVWGWVHWRYCASRI